MRTDFTLDNRKVLLPNASALGYGVWYAKRGYWVRVRPKDETAAPYWGRVVGRVTATGSTTLEGGVFLYVAALISDQFAGVRWCRPDEVVECQERVPSDLLLIATLDCSSLESIKAAMDPTQSFPLSLGQGKPS